MMQSPPSKFASGPCEAVGAAALSHHRIYNWLGVGLRQRALCRAVSCMLVVAFARGHRSARAFLWRTHHSPPTVPPTATVTQSARGCSRSANVCMSWCSYGDLVAAAGSVFSGRGGDCHSEGEDETSNTEALLQVPS